MGLLNIFKKRQRKEDKPKLVKKPGKEKLSSAEAIKEQKTATKQVKTEKDIAKKLKEGKKSVIKIQKGRKKNNQADKILVRPVVTEKSAYIGSYGQYVFKVAPQANKIMVKKAIEEIYGLTPKKINIISISGKQVRHGKARGRTSDWKKAIIILKPGDKIDVYEGV